jgi:hypothetical protein
LQIAMTEVVRRRAGVRRVATSAPSVGRGIVDLEFALATEAAHHIDFPANSATAISLRDEGIGMPAVDVR